MVILIFCALFFYCLRIVLVYKYQLFLIGDDIAHLHFLKMVKSKKKCLEYFFIGIQDNFNYHIFFHKIVDRIRLPFKFLPALNTLLYFVSALSFVFCFLNSNNYVGHLLILFPFFLWIKNKNVFGFILYSERLLTLLLSNSLIFFLFLEHSGNSFPTILKSVFFVLTLYGLFRISMFGFQVLLFLIFPILIFMVNSGTGTYYLILFLFEIFAVLVLSREARLNIYHHLLFLKDFNQFYGIKKFFILNRLRDLTLGIDLLLTLIASIIIFPFSGFVFFLLVLLAFINLSVLLKPFYKVGEGYRYVVMSLLFLIPYQFNQLEVRPTFAVLLLAIYFSLVLLNTNWLRKHQNNLTELKDIAEEIKPGYIVLTDHYRTAELLGHFIESKILDTVSLSSLRFYQKNYKTLDFFRGTYPYFNITHKLILDLCPDLLIVHKNRLSLFHSVINEKWISKEFKNHNVYLLRLTNHK